MKLTPDYIWISIEPFLLLLDQIVVKQVKSFRENNVEPELPMIYAVTATSLITFHDRGSNLICKFFNEDCIKQIIDPDDSDMSDLESIKY